MCVVMVVAVMMVTTNVVEVRAYWAYCSSVTLRWLRERRSRETLQKWPSTPYRFEMQETVVFAHALVAFSHRARTRVPKAKCIYIYIYTYIYIYKI